MAAALNNTKSAAPAPAPARSAPAPAPSHPSYSPAPSHPSYNPAPSHPSYNPAPAHPSYTPAPSHPSYNPAQSHPSYSPAPSGGNSASPSKPGYSAPARSYTPGVPSGGTTSNPSSSSGATTYTPHTFTPGSSAGSSPAVSHPSGSTTVSGEGVRGASGATTYTPHAATGSSYAPAAPSSTHTPAAPAAATHGNTYTPASPAAAGGNTYAPRNSSQGGATGGSAHAVYNVPGSATAEKPGSGGSTLTAAGSQSVLHQVNTARTGLNGINNRPIPQGQVSVHSDKSLTVAAPGGRNFNLRPNGTLASFSAHGQNATFRADGHLASVHTPTMDIAHGSHGQRTVISERPDHSRLVSTGPHSGYMQHSVAFHGHNYNQRMYVHGGHSFMRTYSGYRYHGRYFDNYLPFYYYDPMFYGWAYYPWGPPIGYRWGWAGSPWLAFYAGFFSPWDVYPSGAYWLTDYFLGQTLADGYQMEAQAGGGQPGYGYAGDDAVPAGSDETYAPADTPITPEIKQMIAEEVQQQLAYENAAAGKPDQAPEIVGLPQVLIPNHLFVADQILNVTTADGQQCGLSVGDVIKLVATPPDGADTADLVVVSSRKADCPAGLVVTVPLESLQEMQNNFRAQLDSGLQTLHAQQGQGGLPGAPQSAIAPPPRPVDQPPADSENVQSLLDAQQVQASQAETSVTQSAFAGAKPQ